MWISGRISNVTHYAFVATKSISNQSCKKTETWTANSIHFFSVDHTDLEIIQLKKNILGQSTLVPPPPRPAESIITFGIQEYTT
jgi:hypothetical protein